MPIYSIEIFLLVMASIVSMYAFYRYFESKWPEHYFSPDDQTSIFVSLSPTRYLLFRFLPVAIITALILSISKNFHANERIALGIIAGLSHGIITNGVSIFKILVRDNSVKLYINKFLQIGSNFFTIVIVTLAGAFGGYVSSFETTQKLSPTFQGIVDNLWSSFIAIALFFLLRKIYSATQKFQPVDIYENSYRKIDVKLLDYIKRVANENNADEKLVLAICITENLQRPKWFRLGEKMSWFLFRRKGTYGIMQVMSDEYLSDEESIDFSVRRHLSNTKKMNQDYSTLEGVISGYNSDQSYVATVMEAYSYLGPIL